ncbi:hypothetical protein TNCV_2813601 [Trichonephila clavipes]|nr:hypothetical protein TNCV_2813601 [Trichonephila clavipes]
MSKLVKLLFKLCEVVIPEAAENLLSLGMNFLEALIIRLLTPYCNGRGSLVVKVKDSWPVCVMSSNVVKLKTRCVEGADARHSRLKCPPVGVIWKSGKERVSSDVILVALIWLKITRSVTQNPRAAE